MRFMPQLTDMQSLVQRSFTINTFSRAYRFNAYIGWSHKNVWQIRYVINRFCLYCNNNNDSQKAADQQI